MDELIRMLADSYALRLEESEGGCRNGHFGRAVLKIEIESGLSQDPNMLVHLHSKCLNIFFSHFLNSNNNYV